MILDFVQAKRVHGLRKPCEEYCSELIATPETRFAEDSSEPLLLFSEWLNSEWLKKENPALLPDWYWLCRLTTKNETNRDRGLIELLALALVMEDRTAEKTEALSSQNLKKMVTALAHIHSQFCVLLYAEVLFAKAADDAARQTVRSDLWKLFQINAATMGVLESEKPAKNSFNGVCGNCKKIFRKKLLGLRENETSYDRILLDTYAEALQQDAEKLKAKWKEPALSSNTAFPAAFLQDIPEDKDKNRYAAAAVIWQMLDNSLEKKQMLDNSPEKEQMLDNSLEKKQNLLRDYSLARYGLLPSQASVSKGMMNFGQTPLNPPKNAEETPAPFFRYAVYDASSPALFVVRQNPAWKDPKKTQDAKFMAKFMIQPDSGELFSLCAGLFFALYKNLPTSRGPALKKKPVLPDKAADSQAVWNAFEELRINFPAQAKKSQLEGASFTDFIYFLENYVDTADYRNKFIELLTNPANPESDHKLDFTKLTCLFSSDTASEESAIWKDFCTYWKLVSFSEPRFGRRKKGDYTDQWKMFKERGSTKGSKETTAGKKSRSSKKASKDKTAKC